MWGLVLIGLLVGGAPQSLADRRLPPGRDLSLRLPPAGNASVELAQRMLSAAGVPFGIEQVPPEPSEPPPRIDRPISDRISFDGWLLHDALDKLVALDPRYGWEESNGRIIIRTVALRRADGLLQRRISGFSASDVSQSAVIEMLARALVPGRNPGGVVTLGMTAAVEGRGGTGESTASPPRGPFSVSVGDTTLLDALNLVAAKPGCSWTLRYDAADVTPEAATLSLITPAATTVALSPIAVSRARVATPDRLIIPVTGDLGSVLTWYSVRAKVQTGFVRWPADRREAHTETYPPLDLTGLTTTEALDRVVGLDARYEWTRDGGMYLVRPRRDLVPGTPLDMPVEEFGARGIGVDAVLGRIVRLLAIEEKSAVSAGSMWSGTPEQRESQRLARDRPLSFNARQTTIRGLLNELCKEEGTLSWRAALQPDEQRGLLITLDLQSWTGWGVSRTFVAPAWEPSKK